MDNNPMFVPLPSELGFLVSLQELRLADSGYYGEIPESYTKLMNLSSLCLSDNNLTGKIPTGFGSLPHIFHLNVSKNMLIGVVPFDSSFMRRLGKNLDLSGNSGLCLKPEDEFSVEKSGVDICGRNHSDRDGSFIHPLKRSKASPNHYGVGFYAALLFQFALSLGLVHRFLL